VNKLVRYLNLSPSTVSGFFKAEFGGHNKYKIACPFYYQASGGDAESLTTQGVGADFDRRAARPGWPSGVDRPPRPGGVDHGK